MARRRKPHKQPTPEFVKELCEGIGRVMIAASQIEHYLGIAMAEMLKLTRLQHRALIIPMSISNKIGVLRNLGKEYLDKDEQKFLKGLLEELKDCAELRNQLAHGFYGVRKGVSVIITHSGDARFSGQPTVWKPTQLQALSKRMIAARDTAPQIQAMFPARLKLPKIRQPIASSVQA